MRSIFIFSNKILKIFFKKGNQHLFLHLWVHFLNIFFKDLFICDRHREREREREGQRHRRREKQPPCREPNVGLDPRTPGSRPGPKAGAKLLSHPGIPYFYVFSLLIVNIVNSDKYNPHNQTVWGIQYFKRFYLFNHDRHREREAETQAEGEEAGSVQGAWCGTQSWDSGITPWTEGRCSTAEPPRRPKILFFKWKLYIYMV